jgi:hypothetical protein
MGELILAILDESLGSRIRKTENRKQNSGVAVWAI